MVNESTTRSTLTRNVGRSCATASTTNKKTRPIRRSNLLSSRLASFARIFYPLFRFLILRDYLFARLLQHVVPHQAKRAQQRRPVLQVGRENMFYGLLG